MFVDAGELSGDVTFSADVCVIGGGAAGITMARELARKRLNVILVESGGFKFDRETQALCHGVSVGARYPHAAARLRFFGGSTNHWGGQCRRLSALDFEKRPTSDWTGWPFPKPTLDPYYDRALEILDIGKGSERFEDHEQDTGPYPRMLGADNRLFESIVWLQSPPTRMGEKYRSEIRASSGIRCFLNANAIELVSDRDGKAIEQVKARTLGGRKLVFRSKQFVLCGGAVENARLLLVSRSASENGIGNQNDLVGRFFTEHIIEVLVKRALLARPPGHEGFQEEYLQTRAKRGNSAVSPNVFAFASTPTLLEEENLLGFSVSLRRGVKFEPDAAPAGLEALMRNFPTPAPGAEPRDVYPYSMLVQCEQAPDPRNRVYLSDQRDALGLPQVAIDWRRRAVDGESLLKSLNLFARELQKTGNGRTRLPGPDELEPEGSTLFGHQMGTTRMADDPKRGVTDAWGRVHGVSNLYIASCSLFPTVGYVNPTLTLIALTLRMSERIVQRTTTS